MTDLDAVPAGANVPHIGAFVLETLTLGMYGEPRHTLREYVQNSFDAIRAAQRIKVLAGQGEVTVTVAPDAITIWDNGIGIPSGQVWRTLTAVGASKKDRQRDAGFRGIGRLAGMAYCDTLIFRTTFSGETDLSTVTFDCEKLLKAMDPDEGGDIGLAKLLMIAVRFEVSSDAAKPEDHFFEVTLRGLERAPATLTDPQQVREYLSENAPVEFEPTWDRRHEIEAGYKSHFGAGLETIALTLKTKDTGERVYKPYGDTYSLAKKAAELEQVEIRADPAGRYWGWIGRLNESGAVVDPRTRGLRVRVRNIQVGGTATFEWLFAQVNPSYDRFTYYYIGEIHLDPECVIPNARRDGFEETDEWMTIKTHLVNNICQPLARDAYQASRKRQVDAKKVVDDIEKLVERSETLARSSRASYDQVVDLMNAAKRHRRNASAALKIVGDIDEVALSQGDSHPDLSAVALEQAARTVEGVETQARMLMGQFLGEDERTEALRARIRQEVVDELLGIVNVYVDAGTYQKIRRHFVSPEHAGR